MSTESFADYARYYDVFYRDKDYATEAGFVDGLLRKAGVRGGALLEIGCGTGVHAREFARLGWSVTGVDRSPAMIELATQRTAPAAAVNFCTGSGASFDLGRMFAAAVSLFHVASYHAGPGELDALLRNVRRHLPPGGVFVFDFWHGPGVLADPPAVRTRTFHDGPVRITRVSRPQHDPTARTVEVDYEVTVELGEGKIPERFSERHLLRYFFSAELAAALAGAGFQIERTRAGLEDKELDERSWYGLVVARAI